MRLGVDIRWMLGRYRGMGRFSRQLIAPVHSSVVALAPNGINSSEWPCISQGRGFFPWWEQKVLPNICRQEKLDFLLCPYNTGPLTSLGTTRSIAVIHDLIFMQPWSVLPPSMSIYQTLGRIYRRKIVPEFAKRADIILTVSNFTKCQLIESVGLCGEQIHVIPNAISDSWLEPTLSIESRKPYIFSVAGEAPSKNVSGLLQAFSISLPKVADDISLKIAGIKSKYHKVFKQQAENLGIANRVELLGFLSDDELRNYYKEARLFVFASLFEGFGIPLLEAMACGTPIACSNTTSMPEVIGSCGVTFDPSSAEDISEKICFLWNSKKQSALVSESGVVRVRNYSESAIAHSMDSFWRQLS